MQLFELELGFGYRLKPEHWDNIAKTAEMAFLWPLQENRAPGTVMLLTLLGILLASITARQGWRWKPGARISRRLRKFLPLLGERAGVRADQGRDAFHRVPYFPEKITDDVEIAPAVLTPRQRRWFIQPLWRQSLSVLLIVALMLATTNTDVHAAIPNPIFYYHVGDHLGSSNLVTDRNGALVQHREYWAFGQQRVRSESAQDYVFNRYTGQTFDDETGLYYYGARYYDPELGRFIQPDTIVPDPGNSQSLNRYSYVFNNPLKYVDPTGHDPATIIAVAVIVGAVVGATSAAAQGANGQGIALAALAGALGGLFGGVGAWAGGVIGASASGLTGAAAAASTAATVGTFAGAVTGGAAGGAVGAAVTGGNIGMGALTGAISGAIAFGVGQFNIHVLDGALSDFSVSVIGGGLGGGVGAELHGGDFWEGAAYGAAGAAIGSTLVLQQA